MDATDAATVVGEHVTLGPDTDVAVVYTDDLDADPTASVGEHRPFEAYCERRRRRRGRRFVGTSRSPLGSATPARAKHRR